MRHFKKKNSKIVSLGGPARIFPRSPAVSVDGPVHTSDWNPGFPAPWVLKKTQKFCQPQKPGFGRLQTRVTCTYKFAFS